jgi:hypothetical protein
VERLEPSSMVSSMFSVSMDKATTFVSRLFP